MANSGCPFCTVFPQSKDELIILFELKLLFNEIDVKGQRIRINNKVLAVDIFIKSLNLAIEFDGSYWHKDKFLQDKEKSDLLLKGDIQTIRIRQNPLTKTAENDIFADKKVNYKKVLNDILGNILKNYTNKLSTFQIEQINDYLHLNDLLNISKAQKYIEDLLRKRGELKTQKPVTQKKKLLNKNLSTAEKRTTTNIVFMKKGANGSD
jgi:very-short-patch-repair endonuclease